MAIAALKVLDMAYELMTFEQNIIGSLDGTLHALKALIEKTFPRTNYVEFLVKLPTSPSNGAAKALK